MKIRVLIVDEAAFVRDALKRALRRFLKDAEVHDAVNGNRALAVLRTNKINLILSDWDLPEMSGQELLEWVRNDANFAKTPFIMTSGEGDRNIVIKAIEAGANDFIAKPFTPEEVQKKVVKQLARIGYKTRERQSNNQGSGFGSIDVLTGSANKVSPQKPKVIKSAGDFGRPAKAKTAAKVSNFKGKAHIHLPKGTITCQISELSLTALNGTIERPPETALPHLFESGSADIENARGESVGQLTFYIHGLQAAQQQPDANQLKVFLRFTNNTPEAFERLSKAIAHDR